MRGLLLLSVLFLVGCTLADKFSPDGGTPAPANAFRRGTNEGRAPMPREEWWTVFQEPQLDQLIGKLEAKNPDLAAASARVRQSYAVLGQSRSNAWPSLSGESSVRGRRDSVNELLFPIDQPEYERFRLGVSTAWEIDLWGRVRGMVKHSSLLAELEAESFRDTRLSLEAQLARQFFAWKTTLSEQQILEEAVRIRQDDLRLQEARLELGAGVEVDVTRSRGELASAQAATEAAMRSGGKLEHAMAILMGLAPSEWEPPSRQADRKSLPSIPSGVPVSLLQQRPDLRVADRRLKAAALKVGLTKLDYWPRISLTGSGGVGSLQASDLFKSDSTFFDIGPEIQVPLFSMGLKGGAVAEAKAAWEEEVERFWSSLLTAVGEVDDALLDLQSLARELTIQEEGLAAAAKTSDLARLRHERGLSSYFEIVDAERVRLTARRAVNALEGDRFAATVRLIQALGGGW